MKIRRDFCESNLQGIKKKNRQLLLPGHIYRKQEVEYLVLISEMEVRRNEVRQSEPCMKSLNGWSSGRMIRNTDFTRLPSGGTVRTAELTMLSL